MKTFMLVGIVSDTHDQVKRLSDAVLILKEKGAEVLFHCGDLVGPEAVRACRALKSYFVLGNNDHDVVGIKKAVAEIHGFFLGNSGEVSLGGKRIAMTHGSDRAEFQYCLDSGPDFLLVGHSHKASQKLEKKTWVINPGALHRAPSWTFALLDTETGKAKFLTLPKS